MCNEFFWKIQLQFSTKEVDVICLDFNKAFEKVPHQILLLKLQMHSKVSKSIILVKTGSTSEGRDL